MSFDRDKPAEPVSSRLVDAVRQIRVATADRTDVVVDMREATRTRLELLAEDLKPVINDVPPEDDRFDFALSSGLQPRFWIDATAHVAMGPDRRTYRFVRDTRLGRILLAESSDRAEVIDRVVAYIAMRIHERELAFGGDLVSYRELVTGQSIDLDSAGVSRHVAEKLSPPTDPTARPHGNGTAERDGAARKHRGEPASTVTNRAGSHAQAIAEGLLWILLGIVIGSGTLLLVFQNALLQR